MAPAPFVAHCIELLGSVGAVRSGRMFGGHGFYVDDVFIALVANERLYLKTDALTRPAFEAAGSAPFTYRAAGKGMTSTSYFSAPEQAMESPPLMQPWARLALAAALRARAAKPRAARSATKAKARKPSAARAPTKL